MLQSEVARTVADQVRVALTPADQRRLGVTRTVNPEAYNLYLQSKALMDTERNFVRHKEALLRKALVLDPTLVEARVELAGCFLGGVLDPSYGGRSTVESLALARAELEQVARLAPDSAQAHAVLARVLRFENDWPGFEREAELAYALDPGNPDCVNEVIVSRHYSGRYSEACTLERHLWGLWRPDIPARALTFCPITAYDAGHYDEMSAGFQAVKQYDRNEADSVLSSRWLAFGYAAQGRFDEAAAYMERADRVQPYTPWKGWLAYIYGRQGRVDKARAVLAELLSMRREKDAYVIPTAIASAYEGLGERDEVFAWLDVAYSEHDPKLALIINWPLWSGLRADPRYTALLDRMNVPQAWRRK